MKRAFSILGMLLLTGQAQAITWNFDQEGDSQGWVAQTGDDMALLRWEVRDGVWRIALAGFDPGRRIPLVQITSNLIGRDSELYDHLRIRLRFVHTQPVVGTLALEWRNSVNEKELVPGVPPQDLGSYDALDFYKWVGTLYTTEWQEVTIDDLRSEEHSFQRETGGPWLKGKTVWEGELLDLALFVSLDTEEVIPESALEIDWIQLTGAEEQLQGEGPPPGYEAPVPGGALFSAATFCPLRNGIGVGLAYPVTAALGDLDGDGDLDLVTTWDELLGHGWLTALNDGKGHFDLARIETYATGANMMSTLQGADLDKDGLMDLVANNGTRDLKVLQNRAEEGFVLVQEFPDTWGMFQGDADGDGHPDLWTMPWSSDRTVVWLNNGKGRFDRSYAIGSELLARSMIAGWLILNPAERAEALLWWSVDEWGKEYRVMQLAAGEEGTQQSLATHVVPNLLRYAGDLDQDGDVDLAVAREGNQMRTAWVQGLDLLVNRGDGSFAAVTWSRDVRLFSSVEFHDLNGDGLLDMVCADGNPHGPAVLVALGQKDRVPVLEGRYPITGQGGAVLPGDVDGDGDTDLVVLEKAALEGGGVHVLLNQLAERRNTAVTEERRTQPARFRLGANYPNPFNPQTWIPLEVPGGDQPVQLRVYNVLGQPVRTLVDGRLGSGPHRVPWDGRDSRGQEVSSGTYLYRLQVGSQQATGKMVKSE